MSSLPHALRDPDPLVTVLVPTHDHVGTLRHSITSALHQTHPNLEVLVIGDDAPPEAEAVVAALAATDPRVSYHSFPKGGRTGEPHRHHVLTTIARGSVVAYLADDDLWLPTHLETLLARMREPDAPTFVTCQPAWVQPPPLPAHRWVVDLALPWYRTELLAGRNRIPLSCAAHTRALYDALPHGWRSTPNGTPTDLYMWQQLLDHPDCRAASTDHTTTVGFPAPFRTHMSLDERIAELAAWMPLTDPATQLRFLELVQGAEPGGLRAHAALEVAYETTLAAAHAAERDHAAALHELRHQIDRREQELRTIYASRGWRALERLRRLRPARRRGTRP